MARPEDQCLRTCVAAHCGCFCLFSKPCTHRNGHRILLLGGCLIRRSDTSSLAAFLHPPRPATRRRGMDIRLAAPGIDRPGRGLASFVSLVRAVGPYSRHWPGENATSIQEHCSPGQVSWAFSSNFFSSANFRNTLPVACRTLRLFFSPSRARIGMHPFGANSDWIMKACIACLHDPIAICINQHPHFRCAALAVISQTFKPGFQLDVCQFGECQKRPSGGSRSDSRVRGLRLQMQQLPLRFIRRLSQARSPNFVALCMFENSQ